MFKDRAIVLLAAGQTLTWAGLFYVFPAMLLRWERTLGWSKAELTAAITLAVLISAAFSPLAGRLLDAGRGAQMMAGSAVLGGGALALLSLVTMPWQFYTIWALIGMALAGCLYEPCFAIVTRARGSRAKQGIIFITLVAGFASAISFPSAHTLAEWFGWRSTVVAFGAVVISIAAPLLWVGARALEPHDTVPPITSRPTEPHREFLRRPMFWFFAFSFALLALAHGTALHHLLPILDEFRVAPETAVVAVSFIGPMQVAGRLALLAAADRVSHNAIALAAFAVIGLSILCLIGARFAPTFLVLFVTLFGGAWGTVSIMRPVLARDILGEANFGAKSGALAVPFLAGSASAPYLGALVWGFGGYDLVLPLLIVVLAVGCGLYVTAYVLSQRRAT